MYVVLKIGGIVYKKSDENSTKITKENFAKRLKNAEVYAIIYERDCDRYAKKREVAAERCRFFRGVCPILNRAKEYMEFDSSLLVFESCLTSYGLLCTPTFLIDLDPDRRMSFRFLNRVARNTRKGVRNLRNARQLR
jgi:hypothetical protein